MIPSKTKYLTPDWLDSLLTSSLIGTLKISFWLSSNATASSVSLRFGNMFDARSAIGLSSSFCSAAGVEKESRLGVVSDGF